MTKKKQWICFFSQTGSEIENIRKALKRDPDILIMNGSTTDRVNPDLLKDLQGKIVFLPYRPSDSDYKQLKFEADCLITLHGWLRILPGWFCDKYEIYNGHPGDVSMMNGVLKGANPQEKAFNLRLSHTGSTIHRCTAELDGGAVMDIKPVSIEGLTLDEVYKKLHENSSEQWIKFLKNKL